MFDQSGDNVVRELTIGRRIIPWHDLDVVSSTMDTARHLAIKGQHSWAAVTAHYQHSGRGTHGRDWVSRRDSGLWLSLILPPPVNERVEGLSLVSARVLVAVLERLFSLSGVVKEPNDVLIGGRKIAGILLESESTGCRFDFLILGLGLNLTQDRSFFNEVNLPDATSVFCETGLLPERDVVLRAFISSFIDKYLTGAW